MFARKTYRTRMRRRGLCGSLVRYARPCRKRSGGGDGSLECSPSIETSPAAACRTRQRCPGQLVFAGRRMQAGSPTDLAGARRRGRPPRQPDITVRRLPSPASAPREPGYRPQGANCSTPATGSACKLATESLRGSATATRGPRPRRFPTCFPFEQHGDPIGDAVDLLIRCVM